ncbi:hypothetical protein L1987_38602 [Smallanthus sonchifolius]|uniref:Uncharacterized protein n=1 Tax=Smallanthus sonchifolius TaxID=185202 RepID=A0ACB9HL02_9ASTR|nr:hypothetical protein L1987_38602 [Smallanthus sonchifolius]
MCYSPPRSGLFERHGELVCRSVRSDLWPWEKHNLHKNQARSNPSSVAAAVTILSDNRAPSPNSATSGHLLRALQLSGNVLLWPKSKRFESFSILCFVVASDCKLRQFHSLNLSRSDLPTSLLWKLEL